MLASVKQQRAALQKKLEETFATANTLEGAIQAYDNVVKICEFTERGAAVPVN